MHAKFKLMSVCKIVVVSPGFINMHNCLCFLFFSRIDKCVHFCVLCFAPGFIIACSPGFCKCARLSIVWV